MSKKGNNSSSKKTVGIIIVVIAVVLVAAAIVSIYVYKKAESQDKDGSAYNYQEEGYIKLGTYKDVVVDTEATEEDLQYAIDEFCNENGVKKDVVLKKGDVINIDYTGKVDGKEFEGGTSEDEELTLGDYEYMEDFEDGLIGKKVGTTVTVPVKFPDDYGDEVLNGKTAEFEIKINSIQAPFTDETVKRATKGKYKTAEEYKEKLKQDVKKENEEAKLDTAWEQVKDGAELSEVPDELQEIAENDTNLNYAQFAEIQGISVEEVLGQFGMTEDDIPELAADLAKERMIAKTIAAIEGITVDDTYYKSKLINLVGDDEAENLTIEELEKSYKESQSSRPKDDILIERVKEFIGQSVKVAE